MKSQDRVKLQEFSNNRVRLESTSGNNTNLNRVSDKIVNFGIKGSERHVNPNLLCRERVSVKRVQRAVVHTGQFSEDRVSARDSKINLGRVSDINASLGRVSNTKVHLGRVSDYKVNLGRVSDNKASRVCDDRVTLLTGSGDIRDATSPFRTG
jgi:hypothetical protein